ncbi:MAG: exonuclease SbcCD subunit D [Prevotella sp.]|nr:exonuclease SbcCD subunit D [Prevotella sp.]
MRVLHTSDWHLGHEMHTYKRHDEFDDFFRQLTAIVGRHQPDVLLVSGDVYHSAVPSTATQTMYTEAMLALHEACPTMEVIVTAGNHDSASRLEVDRSLWRHFKVHVVGGIPRTSEGTAFDSLIFHIAGKGIVAAVPHVFRQNFPPPADGSADRQKAFYQGLLNRVGEVNADRLPVVLMAHLAVSDILSGRQPYEAGGQDYLPLSVLGEGYDYAALGHLHSPHEVPSGNPHVRYAGAPLAITFNEEYEHSVTLVEVQAGTAPVVEVLPLSLLRPVKTIPEEAVAFEDALAALAALPDDDPCYIRLNVRTTLGLPPDASEQALRVTHGKACRFCTFRIVDERRPGVSRESVDITPDEFRQMDPLEITRRYLLQRGLPTEEFMEMMQQTLNMIEEEKAR